LRNFNLKDTIDHIQGGNALLKVELNSLFAARSDLNRVPPSLALVVSGGFSVSPFAAGWSTVWAIAPEVFIEGLIEGSVVVVKVFFCERH
jgi:hypothetical protein